MWYIVSISDKDDFYFMNVSYTIDHIINKYNLIKKTLPYPCTLINYETLREKALFFKMDIPKQYPNFSVIPLPPEVVQNAKLKERYIRIPFLRRDFKVIGFEKLSNSNIDVKNPSKIIFKDQVIPCSDEFRKILSLNDLDIFFYRNGFYWFYPCESQQLIDFNNSFYLYEKVLSAWQALEISILAHEEYNQAKKEQAVVKKYIGHSRWAVCQSVYSKSDVNSKTHLVFSSTWKKTNITRIQGDLACLGKRGADFENILFIPVKYSFQDIHSIKVAETNDTPVPALVTCPECRRKVGLNPI